MPADLSRPLPIYWALVRVEDVMREDDRELLVHAPAPGVLQLTLNRPAQRNALNCELLAQLRQALDDARDAAGVRLVLLRGAGQSFCAGGDRAELRRIAEGDEALNQRQAELLVAALLAVFELPKPVIALVQGPAVGAGAALVAASDIALAASEAHFAFPEARLGLVPMTVAPYLVHALGERAARRWFLAGDTMSAAEALRLSLVHECLPAAELLPRALALAGSVMTGGPVALAATKALLRRLSGRLPDATLAATSAAELRRERRAGESIARLAGRPVET